MRDALRTRAVVRIAGGSSISLWPCRQPEYNGVAEVDHASCRDHDTLPEHAVAAASGKHRKQSTHRHAEGVDASLKRHQTVSAADGIATASFESTSPRHVEKG